MSSRICEDLFFVTSFLKFHDNIPGCWFIFIHCSWYWDLSNWKLKSFSFGKFSQVVSLTFLHSIFPLRLFFKLLFRKWTSTTLSNFSIYLFPLFFLSYLFTLGKSSFKRLYWVSHLYNCLFNLLELLFFVFEYSFLYHPIWVYGYKIILLRVLMMF